MTVTLTLTLFLFLKKTRPWPCFLALENLNIITQFWKNYLMKCLVLKELFQYQVHATPFKNVWKPNSLNNKDFILRESTHSCRIIYNIIHTVISKASTLWTPLFWPFPTLRLTGYSTNTNKEIRKMFELPQRFGLLHHVKQIAIILVFLCSPLTLRFFLLYSN